MMTHALFLIYDVIFQKIIFIALFVNSTVMKESVSVKNVKNIRLAKNPKLSRLNLNGTLFIQYDS